MPFPIVPVLAGLSGLAGILGGGGKKAPSAAELGRMFGPQTLSRDTLQLYRMLAQSPQFSQLLGQNAITGQQFQGNLASGLAQRGLSTSGIGTIANAAGQSAIATGESALRGGLFGTAGSLAQQNLLARLSAFTEMGKGQVGQPSFLGQLSGDVLGSLAPLLFRQGGGSGSLASSGAPFGGLFMNRVG